MGHGFHGYVKNNQRVNINITRCHQMSPAIFRAPMGTSNLLKCLGGGGFPHVLVWSPSCYMFVWTDHDGDVVSYRRRWLVCFGHGWCLNWCIFWVTHSWYTDTVACLMQTWGGAFGWEQEVAIRKPREFHHHHIMIIITLKVATPLWAICWLG